MQAETQIHCCWKSVQRRDKFRQGHQSTAAGNLYREGINSSRDTNPLLLDKFKQRHQSTAAGNLYREGINSGKDPNPLLLEICTVKG